MPCRADDMVGWRGDGSGLFLAAKPPLKWAGNIHWKTEVGPGMSSPIVVGDRVFITAEPDLLVCVDRNSGKLLWKKSNRFDDLPKEMKVKPEMPPTECGYTTPSPVSDGKRVVAVLGNGLLPVLISKVNGNGSGISAPTGRSNTAAVHRR